jgi:uncharacterized membrane protein
MTPTDQVQSSVSPSNDRTLRLELMIAQLLRWGVVISFLIVTTGIAAVFGTEQTGYRQIRLNDLSTLVEYHTDSPPFPNSLGAVFSGALALKPYAIISLGLLVLIAIPVMRVAVSTIAFALERDWLYGLITAFVFAMLMLSFAIGEAGG